MVMLGRLAEPKLTFLIVSQLQVVPEGMSKLLRWIKKEYDNPPVYVTENGVSDKGGLNDYVS
jgi:beta-glucosidase/6-phospho-beta-glucosidase/beta-galactosidase